MRLAAADTGIQYAYLVAARRDRIVFLANSRGGPDPDAPIPDPEPEAADAYRAALHAGKAVFYPRIDDAHGSWVRVLVPVRHAASEAAIALFGIDYDAAGGDGDEKAQRDRPAHRACLPRV